MSWRILLYGCAVAVKHIITDWGTNFGYCKMNPYRRSLDPIEAGRGDVVEIRFAPPFHVYRYRARAWEKCDDSSAELLAKQNDGGGCAEDDFLCLEKTKGFELEIEGDEYLAGRAEDCKKGLKIAISASSRRPALEGEQSAAVVVPAWTDDYGYCGSRVDSGHGTESTGDCAGDDCIISETKGSYQARRPRGLAPITVRDGDRLVFKYSTKHNVGTASAAAYQKCALADMTEIGDRQAGGGCDDTDLDCVLASPGFEVVASRSDPNGVARNGGVDLYFVCLVGDHCVNGQKLRVTVLDREEIDVEPGGSGWISFIFWALVIMCCAGSVVVNVVQYKGLMPGLSGFAKFADQKEGPAAQIGAPA